MGGWRKLHNEELHNLNSSPSIITMIMSRKMRRAGNVARMGAKRTVYLFFININLFTCSCKAYLHCIHCV
jgi:hypothetical protein